MVREDNEVRLRGRLTRDPDVKEDIGVVNFTLAVDGAGRKDKETVSGFYDITLWIRQSDYVAPADLKYITDHIKNNTLKKGTLVSVRGRLNQDNWTTADGNRSKINVVADNVSVLHNPEPKEEGASSGAASTASAVTF